MTKQLAPIETLALETGLLLKTTNLDLCPSYLTKLEALRKAIISDFVSTLEPVHSQFFDVDKWYDYLNEKHKKNTIEAGYLHRDLYDLSEWKTK